MSPDEAVRSFGNLREYVDRVVHPDDRKRISKALARPVKELSDYRIDYRILRPDGSVRHVFEIGEIVYDAEGRPLELAGTIQDISELKEVEEALGQSEDRYRRLVELLPEGIFINAQGKIALANPAAIKLLGAASLDELLDTVVLDIIHSDYHDVVRRRVADAEDSDKFLPRMDQVYIGLDGREFPVEASASPIRFRDRPAVLTVFRDITDRKRAEAALRASQAQTAKAREQLVEAIETIPEGFAWFDAEDRLVLFNSRYRELYSDSAEFIRPGARFEDIAGRSAERGQLVEAAGRVEEWLRERIERHRNPKEAFYQRLTDGRWLQVEERKLPGGGIVGIHTEITRLKEMEDELLRKERLATLGQLTGTVSHELRNPLGAIRTSVMAIKALTEDIDRPRLRDSVDIADRSVTRCDKIITDLLDVTRTPKLRPQRTSIDEWLAAELDEYQLPPTVVLRRDLESKAYVAFDHDRLGRALRNVIDNACQAMEASKDGSDKVLTVATTPKGDRIEISVTDTGPGIAPDKLSKVFEPLYSTKSFGVGLGMPMVRQILQQHGGGVEITGNSGHGASVALWLPVELAEYHGSP
jgi:PAS domain S-box-containing protein